MKKQTNMGLGIALGVLYGLLFHNMVVGLILGVILGLIIPAKKKDGSKEDGPGNLPT